MCGFLPVAGSVDGSLVAAHGLARSVASEVSRGQDWTWVPSVGGRILNQCTTREAPVPGPSRTSCHLHFILKQTDARTYPVFKGFAWIQARGRTEWRCQAVQRSPRKEHQSLLRNQGGRGTSRARRDGQRLSFQETKAPINYTLGRLAWIPSKLRGNFGQNPLLLLFIYEPWTPPKGLADWSQGQI